MKHRTSHRRRYGKSLEQRVWRSLRDNPGERPGLIAERLGVTPMAVSKTLERLTVKDAVRGEGCTHARKYYAVGIEPDDMRGTSVETIAALKRFSRARRDPSKIKHKPRVKHSHALDKVWSERNAG